MNFLGNKYGNRLVYVAIAVNTTLKPASLGYSNGLPVYREWEDFVEREVCGNGRLRLCYTAEISTTNRKTTKAAQKIYSC